MSLQFRFFTCTEPPPGQIGRRVDSRWSTGDRQIDGEGETDRQSETGRRMRGKSIHTGEVATCGKGNSNEERFVFPKCVRAVPGLVYPRSLGEGPREERRVPPCFLFLPFSLSLFRLLGVRRREMSSLSLKREDSYGRDTLLDRPSSVTLPLCTRVPGAEKVGIAGYLCL